jgi:3-dehydroquinate synthase
MGGGGDMKSVHIETNQSYDVLIDKGVLDETGEILLERFGKRTAAVITDDTVDALYGERVTDALSKAGFCALKYAFPGGETYKSMATATDILAFLSENNVTRGDILLALGGGIAGDVAGFCAAIYLRGIRFVQLPTTFLAAIDSSVGGKTGVNLPAGKNLAGAFWQPSLVLCDVDAFATLPHEIFLDGVAEAIKYGVLWDETLFERLAQSTEIADIKAVVSRCVKIKSLIVTEDERDTGRRRLLNLGHTLGHAIENAGGYRISHGHAVAIGMAAAARAAEGMGIAKAPCAGRIASALVRYGLPVWTDLPRDALCRAMGRDKKRAGDILTLVLPERVGVCRPVPVPVSELPAFVKFGIMEGSGA